MIRLLNILALIGAFCFAGEVANACGGAGYSGGKKRLSKSALIHIRAANEAELGRINAMNEHLDRMILLAEVFDFSVGALSHAVPYGSKVYAASKVLGYGVMGDYRAAGFTALKGIAPVGKVGSIAISAFNINVKKVR